MIQIIHGYGSIPIDTLWYILVGWTSIYQLFWGSLGTRVLTHCHMIIQLWISLTKSMCQDAIIDIAGHVIFINFLWIAPRTSDKATSGPRRSLNSCGQIDTPCCADTVNVKLSIIHIPTCCSSGGSLSLSRSLCVCACVCVCCIALRWIVTRDMFFQTGGIFRLWFLW